MQKFFTGRLSNYMMKNNSHLAAGLDSIVEDDSTRKVLENLNLMPSSWVFTEDEQRRILSQNIIIRTNEELEDPHWPSFVNHRCVIFSSNAFLSGQFTREQLLAILLHEVGHVVNPLDAIDEYLTSLSKIGANQATKPANLDELYADDYVRHCGYSNHLSSGLRKLSEVREVFRIQSVRDRVARIEVDERPLLLNLKPFQT